ncbi:MAG: hypothetical protein LBL56_06310, partial [Treponema sp.]|nr:hypothetical protein [Treponema sp.]
MEEKQGIEEKSEKELIINSGMVCLLNDAGGVLDAYTGITVNCGAFMASPEIYAKLAAKNARINTGDLKIQEVKGRIIQLDADTVIDGGMDLKGLSVLASGNLIARGEGVKSLGETEGVVVLGTLYYPASGDFASLAKVQGRKQAYPDGARVFLGDQNLGKILTVLPPDVKHLWIDGTLNAPDARALEAAKAAGLKVDCNSLFTYEGLYGLYAELFHCPDLLLVPDGYEITGNLESAQLPLYGPKIYVNGNFNMESGDLLLLEALEAIVVRGRAKLPSSVVSVFRKKGKAGDYEIFEGRLMELNGDVHWGHRQFADAAGEKLTVKTNGCFQFDDDVTEEDLECIAALSYNGVVLIPHHLKSILSSKVKEANGFMGDPEDFKKTTG